MLMQIILKSMRTRIKTVFKNAIHNKMDIFFENLFGNVATYDVFF